MLRKLVAAIIGVSALVPGTVFGLGMGEVKLNSFLNQPLEARIELQQTRGLSSSEIIASLASTSEFTAAGVDRSFFLSQLQFEIVQGENGQTYLQVSSKRPVTEPFLNFLVEVQWPAGRLLREYTLLLDPPEFKDELPLAIRAPVAAKEKTSVSKKTGVEMSEASTELPKVEISTDEQEQIAVKPNVKSKSVDTKSVDSKSVEPKLATESKPAVTNPALTNIAMPDLTQPDSTAQLNSNQETASEAQVAGSTIPDFEAMYTVKRGDTLSGIVKSTQASSDIPLAQALIAYQYLNPDAFIDGNMNLVKRGAVLRIPTESQVRKVDRKEALLEIAKQNKAWQAKIKARRSVKNDEQLAGRQLDGTGRDLTPDSTRTNPDEGRLSLVTPRAEDAVKDGATGAGDKGGDAQKLSALKDQLALETEQVEKYSVANDGLITELQELTSLVEKTDKVLSLKDDQIASLQAQLQALRKDAEMAGVETPSVDSETGDDPAMAVEPVIDESIPVVDGTEQVGQMPDPMVTEGQDEIVDGPDDDNDQALTEFDEAISQPQQTPIWANPFYLGVGGAILMAVLGLLWLRSRADDDDDFEEDDFEEDDQDTEIHDVDGDKGNPDEVLGNKAFSTEQLDRQLLEAEDDFDIDTVLSEADIYVAYGHFPKAIAMLKDGLKESPQSLGLNLKLMDVYAESKDVESFQKLEDFVRGFSSDDQTLSQINTMRKSLGLNAGEGPDVEEAEFGEEETQFLGDEELSSVPPVEDEDFLSLADIEAELDVGGGFGESEETEGPTDDPKENFEEELTVNSQLSSEKTQINSLDVAVDLDDDELDLSSGALDFNFEETSVPDDSFSPDDALADIDEEIGNLNDDLVLSDAAALGEDVEGGNAEALGGLEDLDLEEDAFELDEDFSLDDSMLNLDSVEAQQESASMGSDSLSSEDASLLDGVDEVGTKLDLATAYIEMGDHEGAKDILDEVLLEGNDEQQQLARELLEKV